MHAIHWTEALQSRWQALQAWPLDNASAGIDLVPGLIREQGWTRAEAAAAIVEYRRFCLLACALGPERIEQLVPSERVDAVWHAHLLHSRDYFERFCPEVLGLRLHHAPAHAQSGKAQRLAEAYAQTLAGYDDLFGPPPLREWPGTRERFRQARRRRVVDLDRVLLLPRPRLAWSRAAASAVLLVLVATLASPVAQAALGPLDWRGPEFLALYLCLAVLALGAGLWMRWRLRDTGPARGMGCEDALSVATLAGGESRAADAAVAEMLHSEVLSLDPRGQLQRGGAPLPESEPLRGLAVLATRQANPDQFQRQARPLLSGLRAPLLQQGLLLDPAQAWRVRWQSSLPLLGLLLLGLAKLGVGLGRDKPVAWLALLCLLTAIGLLIWLLIKPQRSRAGDAELKRQRGRNATRLRAPRGQDLGLAVALLGTTALGGTAFAAYHQIRQPGSSDSGSGGDSSDGGDSGGGGCGGCGGD